jgi:hypothetical protein
MTAYRKENDLRQLVNSIERDAMLPVTSDPLDNINDGKIA